MRRMMLAMTLVVLAGCGGADLETRTFQLRYLSTHEAVSLMEPYVFRDREGPQGTLAASASAVTVRETADNLARIERMLAEFDRPLPMVMLHFQIIRANGAAEADPAIAEVERELRRLFRFDGYTLLAETRVGAGQGATIRQIARGGGETFLIQGGIAEVRRSAGSSTITLEVRLQPTSLPMAVLETQVTVPVGHAVVLGTTETSESGALILVVRAEIAGGGSDSAAPGSAADSAASRG